MKRKRDWIALVEYMDRNQRTKQMMQFAFNPKTMAGLTKLVSVMSTQKHALISVEIFRKGHR